MAIASGLLAPSSNSSPASSLSTSILRRFVTVRGSNLDDAVLRAAIEDAGYEAA